MQISVVGLNHKTAAVNVRQRLMFDTEAAIAALKQLKGRFPQGEFVLLSTCNRVEMYCAADKDDGPSSDDQAEFLAEFHGVSSEKFKELLYTYNNEDAVRHLLTTTSSLDSMVVGEPQISAQVKESYQLACNAQSTGKVLNRLFHCAFSTCKNIYTTTSITNRRVSVAGVAVDLAKQLFANIKSSKIVIIGAGQMSKLLIEHFLHIKCKNITIINRSYEKGRSLAKRYGVGIEKWENLENRLVEADIIVAAATATHGYLFEKDSFAKVITKRGQGTLLVIDIAVPRNFEPSINEIEDVYLYCIDDLARVVQNNIKLRQEDLDEAVEIICEKVTEFTDWFATKDLGPLIGQIKDNFKQIQKSEMERLFAESDKDPGIKQALSQSMDRIVNKLLHCVIQNISTTAKQKGTEAAAELAGNILSSSEDIMAGNTDTKKAEL